MTVLVDGIPGEGSIPAGDGAVLRGDGCFEVLHAYGGRAFELDAHLQRLESSAEMLRIELPPRATIGQWVERAAREAGDGAVRIVVTRGGSIPGWDVPSQVLVFPHELPPAPDRLKLRPVRAPWHAAGEAWELAGAKTLSYAPNQAATRLAVSEGFDDALLISRRGELLEGPTFSVAWVVDGRLETPALDLGILDSITRRLVLSDARSEGIEVVEDSFEEARLSQAAEVIAMSTVKEVSPVRAVGEISFDVGPVTKTLAEAFGRRTQLTASQAAAGDG
ncbi:MAG TPA: aminotransferase class IV [Acidimicrobiia bacterium]|jgi:branched-subunit amino acid aminotransferase/4-amino-4-deoxychorismate lyase